MIREEKQKAIYALKISAPIRVVTQEKFNDYIQIINQVMDWLDQETVSKESYDHEYFLRKEFEVKIARLKQQEPVIDKIRAEIIQLIQNGVLKIESGNEMLFNIIDKYKAESEP